MPDSKIVDLISASAISGVELLPIVQNGETKKVTVNSLFSILANITENASGGYLVINNMAIQWGISHSNGLESNWQRTINFPLYFQDSNYTILGSVMSNSNNVFSVNFHSKTQSSASINVKFYGGGSSTGNAWGESVMWLAIGRKV